jgi:hypothetical protein
MSDEDDQKMQPSPVEKEVLMSDEEDRKMSPSFERDEVASTHEREGEDGDSNAVASLLDLSSQSLKLPTSPSDTSLKKRVYRQGIKELKAEERTCLIKLLSSGTGECIGKFAQNFKLEDYLACSTPKVFCKKYNKLKTDIIRSTKVERFYKKADIEKKKKGAKNFVPLQMWSIKLTFKSPTSGDILLEEPWFVVKQSNLENAGFGVFADRKFQKQEAMGLYLGQFLSKTEVDAGETSQYSIKSICLGQYVDAKRGFISIDSTPYYGMGVHMINDPLFTESSTELTKKEQAVRKKLINSTIYDNLLLYATRDITPGEEIYVQYNLFDPVQSNKRSRRSV